MKFHWCIIKSQWCIRPNKYIYMENKMHCTFRPMNCLHWPVPRWCCLWQVRQVMYTPLPPRSYNQWSLVKVARHSSRLVSTPRMARWCHHRRWVAWISEWIQLDLRRLNWIMVYLMRNMMIHYLRYKKLYMFIIVYFSACI